MERNVTAALGLTVGIVVYRFYPGLMPFYISAAFAITSLILSKIRFSDPVRTYTFSLWYLPGVFLLFLSSGGFVSNYHKFYKIPDTLCDEELTIRGFITEISETNYGQRFYVNVSQIKGKDNRLLSTQNHKLIVNTDVSELAPGDEIKFRSRLQSISHNYQSFDSGYIKYLENTGIFYRCNIPATHIIKLGNKKSLRIFALSYRDKITEFIERTTLPTDVSNILISLLLGDREYLDPDIKRSFASTGLSHILALSGLHIAIITSIFLFVFFPINFMTNYKLRLFMVMIATWGYIIISGMSVSSLRAGLMMTSLLMSLILERKNSAISSLALSVIVILFFTPNAIFEIGFQLSVACVLSLIMLAEQLNPFSRKTQKYLYIGFATVLTTLLTTICTWPLTSYYFHRLPLTFLISNLIILPLLPLYLSLAILYIALESIGINLSALSDYMAMPVRYAVQLSDYLGNGSTIPLAINGLSTIILISATIILMLWINMKRRRNVLLWSGIIIYAIGITSVKYMPESVPKHGFIIKSNYGELGYITRDSHIESSHSARKGHISNVEYDGTNIIFVDSVITNREILKYATYIVLGSGYKGKLSELYLTQNQMVLVHPSVFKKREQSLAHEADRFNINFHSLRNEGAFFIVN